MAGDRERAAAAMGGAPPELDTLTAVGEVLDALWASQKEKWATPAAAAKDIGKLLAGTATGAVGMFEQAGPYVGPAQYGTEPPSQTFMPFTEMSGKLWEDLSPASKLAGFAGVPDAAIGEGMGLAAIPFLGSRGRKQGRGFQFFHGAGSREAAEDIIKEGFTRGGSAYLNLPGVSLSRDPNVSLHRFAESDPYRLLAVEYPEELAKKTANFSPRDWFDTLRFLEENQDVGAYNKPSSLYKELETFVRREHLADPSGQYELFTPASKLKARRLTPDELRYATTVEQNVADVIKERAGLTYRSARFMPSHEAEQTTQRARTILESSDMENAHLGAFDDSFPSPNQVAAHLKRSLGTGSSTTRARTAQDMFNLRRSILRGLDIDTWPNSNADNVMNHGLDLKGRSFVLSQLPDTPDDDLRVFSSVDIYLKDGKVVGVPKYDSDYWYEEYSDVPGKGREIAAEKAADLAEQAFFRLDKDLQLAMKQWSTPKGRKTLAATSKASEAATELFDGKTGMQTWASLKNLPLREVSIEYTKYQNSVGMGQAMGIGSSNRYVSSDVMEVLLKNREGRQVGGDKYIVKVPTDELATAMLEHYLPKIRSGLKSREEAYKMFEGL